MHEKVKKALLTFEMRVSCVTEVDSLGDSSETTISIPCYLQEEMKIVTNELGEEVTSSAQVFVDGTDIGKISIQDEVSVGILKPGIPTEEVENPEPIFEAILSNRKILQREAYYQPKQVPGLGVIYLS